VSVQVYHGINITIECLTGQTDFAAILILHPDGLSRGRIFSQSP